MAQVFQDGPHNRQQESSLIVEHTKELGSLWKLDQFRTSKDWECNEGSPQQPPACYQLNMKGEPLLLS